jgi:hypothetical protein
VTDVAYADASVYVTLRFPSAPHKGTVAYTLATRTNTLTHCDNLQTEHPTYHAFDVSSRDCTLQYVQRCIQPMASHQCKPHPPFPFTQSAAHFLLRQRTRNLQRHDRLYVHMPLSAHNPRPLVLRHTVSSKCRIVHATHETRHPCTLHELSNFDSDVHMYAAIDSQVFWLQIEMMCQEV